MATKDSFLTEAQAPFATGGNPHLHHIEIEQLQAPRLDYAENHTETKSKDLFGAIEPHLQANKTSKKVQSKL
ncbi:hypothetical protein BGZ81_004347 [Podila clonocystis]|nr:hypothetical protein BGZ81_004347 [Podila clonocystis]